MAMIPFGGLSEPLRMIVFDVPSLIAVSRIPAVAFAKSLTTSPPDRVPMAPGRLGASAVLSSNTSLDAMGKPRGGGFWSDG